MRALGLDPGLSDAASGHCALPHFILLRTPPHGECEARRGGSQTGPPPAEQAPLSSRRHHVGFT
jgi:hypothetical protein